MWPSVCWKISSSKVSASLTYARHVEQVERFVAQQIVSSCRANLLPRVRLAAQLARPPLRHVRLADRRIVARRIARQRGRFGAGTNDQLSRVL